MQKDNNSKSFYFLLYSGVLLLSQINQASAVVTLNHRQLPCETACISNDDDEPKLSQTDGIVMAAVFGAGVIAVCLFFSYHLCCRGSSPARPTIRTPLLDNSIFHDATSPNQLPIDIELAGSDVDDGYLERIV